MAQLNDLLVMGPSTMLGPTTIQGNLTVNGSIKKNNEEVLTETAANELYLTATISGSTLTITIP